MTNDELTSAANRLNKQIDFFRDQLVPNISNIDNHTRKIPDCLDAIHDQLIELETDIEKNAEYQERSAKALESIAESLKLMAANQDKEINGPWREDV